MDSFIARFNAVADGDLMLCEARGVAWQTDMAAGRVSYDDAYHDKCRSYEGTPLATALNAGRCAMLGRHAPAGTSVLDIGAGSGTFVRISRRWGYFTCGYDIIPKTVELLKSADVYADDPADFQVITFWDSIEHIEDPEALLRRIAVGAIVLVAIPVFEDLRLVRQSRHYRPGEHLYYWTASGFIDWMALQGFTLIEQSNHEIEAGRDSIGAFAFRRDWHFMGSALQDKTA